MKPVIADIAGAPKTPTKGEPIFAFIHQIARDGLSKVRHHGPLTSTQNMRTK